MAVFYSFLKNVACNFFPPFAPILHFRTTAYMIDIVVEIYVGVDENVIAFKKFLAIIHKEAEKKISHLQKWRRILTLS